jgi:hypothetical protein
MTQLPPDDGPAGPPAHDPSSDAASAPLPHWVPVLLGGVLVALAGLAVFTGLRYRTNTLVNIVRPRRAPQTNTPSPPGEPEAGASLMYPGESGDNAPAAHPAVTGRARAVISGTGKNVDAVVRIWARRGLITNVVPDDAVVYVNDVPVGQARQFKGRDEVYDFPAAGSYTVKLTAPGYRDQTYLVTAAYDAKAELAKIDTKLEKQ